MNSANYDLDGDVVMTYLADVYRANPASNASSAHSETILAVDDAEDVLMTDSNSDSRSKLEYASECEGEYPSDEHTYRGYVAIPLHLWFCRNDSKHWTESSAHPESCSPHQLPKSDNRKLVSSVP